MNEELRLYEVLGVRPGASRDELKAAHRDLAKVWHPDRFGHDERLQSKAQEKLKEINEAYDALISGKIKRKPSGTAQPNPNSSDWWNQARAAAAPRSEVRMPKKRSASWGLALITLGVFGVGFFFTANALLRPDQKQTEITGATSVSEDNDAVSSESPIQTGVERHDTSSAVKRSDTKPAETSSSAEHVTASQQVQPQHAVATETVLIDTSTGLLARADCPVKSRITFVSGNQPRQYCTAVHAAPTPKDSKIKSVARKLGIN